MKNISVLDKINIYFLCLNVLVYIITFNKTPYKIPLLLSYLAFAALIYFVIKIRKVQSEYTNLILLVYPIIFLFGIFETFFMILPYFNTQRFDEILIQIDFSMFGTHPTVWIERFISPMLTEIMYILYLFYFPMPIIVMVLLYRNNRLKEIEEGFFIFLSCYYLAYTIYFIVPASGPRFYLHEFQTIPLDGYFLSNPIRELINKLEPNKLDAFPSLHAGIVMSTMIVSYKFARRMFNIFVPIVIGITISLVYCRYHYVIDIIGGFLVSIISYQISSRIYKVIHKNTIFHFRLPLQ